MLFLVTLVFMIETLRKVSLVQEKSQHADITNSAKIAGKICNVFCDTRCPKKASHFLIRITLEMFSLEIKFRYFWKTETCSYQAI